MAYFELEEIEIRSKLFAAKPFGSKGIADLLSETAGNNPLIVDTT